MGNIEDLTGQNQEKQTPTKEQLEQKRVEFVNRINESLKKLGARFEIPAWSTEAIDITPDGEIDGHIYKLHIERDEPKPVDGYDPQGRFTMHFNVPDPERPLNTYEQWFVTNMVALALKESGVRVFTGQYYGPQFYVMGKGSNDRYSNRFHNIYYNEGDRAVFADDLFYGFEGAEYTEGGKLALRQHKQWSTDHETQKETEIEVQEFNKSEEEIVNELKEHLKNRDFS